MNDFAEYAHEGKASPLQGPVEEVARFEELTAQQVPGPLPNQGAPDASEKVTLGVKVTSDEGITLFILGCCLGGPLGALVAYLLVQL